MPVPVEIKVLKDGRVRTHFFAHDAKGPIRTATRIEMAPGMAPVLLGGASGYVACQPKRTVLGGQLHNGRVLLCPCSGEVPAVTCPECIATDVFQKAAADLARILSERA